jgi:hypothetical protein
MSEFFIEELEILEKLDKRGLMIKKESGKKILPQ